MSNQIYTTDGKDSIVHISSEVLDECLEDFDLFKSLYDTIYFGIMQVIEEEVLHPVK